MLIQPGFNYQLAVEQVHDDHYVLQHNIHLPRTNRNPHFQVNDVVDVFIYHDAQQQLIATLRKPYGKVGDLVTLKVVAITSSGAYLDWGIPKDLFVPRSYHEDDLKKAIAVWLKLYSTRNRGV